MINSCTSFPFVCRVTEKFGGIGVNIRGLLTPALDGIDQNSQTL